MARKKVGDSTRNGRDSETKHLGVKRFGGESVLMGSTIICQRGTKFHAGASVGYGRDHTLLTKADGEVKLEVKGPKNRKFISIEAEQAFHVPVMDENLATRCGAFYIR